MREREICFLSVSVSQWPKWLRSQYGKLEICGSSPGYDTNFSLKNYHENLLFETVEKFRYLGVTITNTNNMREEIKRRINIGKACYYSLEKILSSRLLSKKLKVKTYKTIILPVVLYGCETWSLTLREEHRLRVFENKVLRKIFGDKKDEITGEWRKLPQC